MKIFINLLAIFLAVNLVHAQPSPAASIARLIGTAEVKTGKEGTPAPLGKNDQLFAGQSVRCDQSRGCKILEVSFCINVPAKKINSNWSRIFYMPCNTKDGRISGEIKSDKDIITYPKESEVLRLENFFVRWKPLESSVKLDLTLKIEHGKEIYSVKGINGSEGFYQSADMLKKLKEAQMDDEFSFNVILTEHGEEKTKIKSPQSITFMLLTDDKEKSLNERLELFEGETDEVFKLIGRALIFSEYELYTESALEMEKVLLLPQVLNMKKSDENLSKILMLATTANYKSLNIDRTKMLCKKLTDSGYSLPAYACSK